jgi:hypothetical protein
MKDPFWVTMLPDIAVTHKTLAFALNHRDEKFA